MLRATTACTFSTSQLPKVVRTPGVLYILTCTCASRHNGVQFFISHLASWLRTRRFSEPTFRPSGATNHWQNTVFRDFPTFSRTCIFFLLIFFLLTLLTSAFQLSILSEVSLLNFLRRYCVRYCKTMVRMLWPNDVTEAFSSVKCQASARFPVARESDAARIPSIQLSYQSGVDIVTLVGQSSLVMSRRQRLT